MTPGMTNEDISSLEQFTQSWTSREPPHRKYLSSAGRAAAGKQGEAQRVQYGAEDCLQIHSFALQTC